MIICICGSRGYPRLTLVDAFIETLPADITVLSGGARGVDRRAYYRAMLRYRQGTLLRPIEMKAEWEVYGRTNAGSIRNQAMLDAADRVVAFWDGQSGGTKDMIARSLAAGKLRWVYGHDGTIVWGDDG